MVVVRNAYDEFKLYVNNLPFTATEDIIKELFGKFGDVSFVRLCTDQATGRSRGFGFVSYRDENGASAALKNLDDYEFEGRKIKIRNAHSRGSQQSAASGDNGESQTEIKICYSFLQYGSCKFGESCKFSHKAQDDTEKKGDQLSTENIDVVANEEKASETLKSTRKPCFSFLKDGKCKYGSDCKFSHEPVNDDANELPSANNVVADETSCSVEDGDDQKAKSKKKKSKKKSIKPEDLMEIPDEKSNKLSKSKKEKSKKRKRSSDDSEVEPEKSKPTKSKEKSKKRKRSSDQSEESMSEKSKSSKSKKNKKSKKKDNEC